MTQEHTGSRKAAASTSLTALEQQWDARATGGGLTEGPELRPPVQCPCGRPSHDSKKPSTCKRHRPLSRPFWWAPGSHTCPRPHRPPSPHKQCCAFIQSPPSLTKSRDSLLSEAVGGSRVAPYHGIQDWQLSEPTWVQVVPQDQAASARTSPEEAQLPPYL